jgi:hypothetical protein
MIFGGVDGGGFRSQGTVFRVQFLGFSVQDSGIRMQYIERPDHEVFLLLEHPK